VLNALTIDVEDYYQVSAFESVVRFQDWGRYESRVERNTQKVLSLLAASNVKATFFVLGWVAERHPSIVKAIQVEGHEIASHGFAHKVLTAMSPHEFREDIRRAKDILQCITGEAVLGYRAPSFTIMPDTIWALTILAEEGYGYDSSIFPIQHDRYGMPGANPRVHCLSTSAGPLWEIPPSTIQIAGMRIPVGGGGYFRAFPYPILHRLLKKLEAGGQPLIMYLHPWEIDPDQPRMKGPVLSRFRHYLNLHKTEKRFIKLLHDFSFAPVREAIEPIRQLAWEQAVESPTSQFRGIITPTQAVPGIYR
jgi:polysaccharide deacetylase family protein (PEP-CTERM system associated)